MKRNLNIAEKMDRLCDYNDGDTKYTPYLPYKRKKSNFMYISPEAKKLIDEHEKSLPEWMRYEW